MSSPFRAEEDGAAGLQEENGSLQGPAWPRRLSLRQLPSTPTGPRASGPHTGAAAVGRLFQDEPPSHPHPHHQDRLQQDASSLLKQQQQQQQQQQQ